MATEVFRIEDAKGKRLGKVYISEHPNHPNSWVGHAITYDLTTSNLQWTFDNRDALKHGLISDFGEPETLEVIQEQ